MRKLVCLLFTLISLQGCSVYMAAAGYREPDLGIIKIGSTRPTVERELNKAIHSEVRDDKSRVDMYQYVIGNEPSAGRATGHAVMDLLTLCCWEIIGTPIEAFSQGDRKLIRITYNDQNLVTGIE
jgi:hypothetical protein